MKSNSRILNLLLAVLLVIGLVSGPASAAIFDLTSVINGAQANAGAGTGSPGVGSATVQYDDATSELSWDISWSGLLGTETVMHFHGPAGPGTNAGVQVDFGAISGLASPSIGSATISAGQATDLLADQWYINIHTDQFPGGEIRGQVLLVPEPSASLMLLMVLAGSCCWRRIRR